MKIRVIADLHGAYALLKRKLRPALPLMILGDCFNLVDFRTLEGAAAKVMGKGDIARILITLAVRGKKPAAALADRLVLKNPEKMNKLREIAAEEYALLAKMLPADAWVTFGNVDFPDLLAEAVGDKFHDQRTVDIDGIVFGFVGRTPSYEQSLRLAGELGDEVFSGRIHGLPACDVLATHFPADIHDLIFDTVSGKTWGGSPVISEWCVKNKPKLHLCGHVHNPLKRNAVIGETLHWNVGGFRYNGLTAILDTAKIKEGLVDEAIVVE